MDEYKKLLVSLRYFLIGKGFYNAASALEFAARHHSGLRKDNVTPEFQHQVEITHYLRTLLPFFMFPQQTLATAILHDVTEDCDVSNDMIESMFGPDTAQAVFLLDKRGKTTDNYFAGIANNAIASVVKSADRTHNLQTMVGVFTYEKQVRYVQEVEQYFLPMLKAARRMFVTQECAYENIKHVLNTQVELFHVIHSSTLPSHASK